MATKKSQDKQRLDPLNETLIIHDRKTGSIKAISEFQEGTGKYSTVDPLEKNAPAFVKIQGINPLRNFYRNFISQYDDPTQFAVYRVPKSEVQDLTANLSRLNDDPKDENALKAVGRYRISGRQLDRIKIDKTEFPWDELRVVGITPESLNRDVAVYNPRMGREETVNLLEMAQQGKLTPAEINVRYMIGDRGFIDDKYSLQLDRNEQEEVTFSLKTPLAQPEYMQEQWRTQLGSSDIEKLKNGETLDRLFNVTDEQTGLTEKKYIHLDSSTGRLITTPRFRSDQIPDFMFGVRLEKEQKTILTEGGAVYLEGASRYKDGPEFKGSVQWDASEGRWECYAPRYKYPQIPEYLDKQLSEEDRQRLKNYEPIDGTKYCKKNSDERYRGDIRINREDNWPRYSNTNSFAPKQSAQQRQGGPSM